MGFRSNFGGKKKKNLAQGPFLYLDFFTINKVEAMRGT